MDRVGSDGVVTVEAGRRWAWKRNTSKACSSILAGISACLYWQQTLRAWAVRQKCLTSLSPDKKIASIQEILDFGRTRQEGRKEIVIIAENIEGEALTTRSQQTPWYVLGYRRESSGIW